MSEKYKKWLEELKKISNSMTNIDPYSEEWKVGLRNYIYVLLNSVVTNNPDKYLNDDTFNSIWIPAFTHETFDPINNFERLETLGDSLIGSTFVAYVTENFKNFDPDFITNAKNYYASRLWQIPYATNSLVLNNIIRFPPSVKDNLLKIQWKKDPAGDVFEAIYGAINESFNSVNKINGAGYVAVRTFTQFIFSNEVDEESMKKKSAKDSISEVNEIYRGLIKKNISTSISKGKITTFNVELTGEDINTIKNIIDLAVNKNIVDGKNIFLNKLYPSTWSGSSPKEKEAKRLAFDDVRNALSSAGITSELIKTINSKNFKGIIKANYLESLNSSVRNMGLDPKSIEILNVSNISNLLVLQIIADGKVLYTEVFNERDTGNYNDNLIKLIDNFLKSNDKNIIKVSPMVKPQTKVIKQIKVDKKPAAPSPVKSPAPTVTNSMQMKVSSPVKRSASNVTNSMQMKVSSPVKSPAPTNSIQMKVSSPIIKTNVIENLPTEGKELSKTNSRTSSSSRNKIVKIVKIKKDERKVPISECNLDENPHLKRTKQNPDDTCMKRNKVYQILDDNFPQKEYVKGGSEKRKTLHWGQRKLLLTEIDFLTENTSPNERNTVVIYVGAAPGDHLPYLTKLFPTLKYVFIDPQFSNKITKISSRDFDRNVKIEILSKEFNNDEAIKFQKEHEEWKILFISDIRNLKYNTGEGNEEKIIKEDMEIQKEWINIIDPYVSMIKFRLPYPGEGVNENFEYLDGTLHLQPFAPISSTEVRLIVKRGAKVKNYNIVKHEQQMYYFNDEIRPSYHEYSDFSTDRLDHCYDCTREMEILKSYVNKFIGKINYVDKALEISSNIDTVLAFDKRNPIPPTRKESSKHYE